MTEDGKPIQAYQCSFCGKQFLTPGYWAHHEEHCEIERQAEAERERNVLLTVGVPALTPEEDDHLSNCEEQHCAECAAYLQQLEAQEREAEMRGRHPIVQKWLAGETDAEACIAELEQALIRAAISVAAEGAEGKAEQ